jgi:transcriptional regulator with XRE-family HTH domain
MSKEKLKEGQQLIHNTFGAIVRREREKQGLSLAKLAKERLEGAVNASYINRLETGEKHSPSFQIVALLSQALDLDMREVFRAFEFEDLIENYDKEADFTMEELIRLHKIKFPTESETTSFKLPDRNLNHLEQEGIIAVLNALFDYALEEGNTIGKLQRIIEESEKLREIVQKERSTFQTLFVQGKEVTFTVQFDRSMIQVESQESWEKSIEKAIKAIEFKLYDYPKGMLMIPINGETWVVQKEGHTIKVLCKQDQMELITIEQ